MLRCVSPAKNAKTAEPEPVAAAVPDPKAEEEELARKQREAEEKSEYAKLTSLSGIVYWAHKKQPNEKFPWNPDTRKTDETGAANANQTPHVVRTAHFAVAHRSTTPPLQFLPSSPSLPPLLAPLWFVGRLVVGA